MTEFFPVPDGALAPAESVDWPELAKACAEVWPDLVWKGDAVSESVIGCTRAQKIVVLLYRAVPPDLFLSIAPRRQRLPPPWSTKAAVSIKLSEAPEALPLLLAEGRVWWLAS